MRSYQPNRITRESVTSKAAAEISRYIESSGLHPGDRLPAEAELARMLGVSRGSVREALRILEALNRIEKRTGRSVIVRPPADIESTHPDDTNTLAAAAPVVYQTRMLVERRCAELAATSARPEDLADISEHLARMDKFMTVGDFVPAAEEHRAFHDALVAAARNPILEGIYRQVRFMPTEIVRRGFEIYKDHRHQEIHAAIHDAVRAGEPARAAEAVSKHFASIVPLVDFIVRSRVARHVEE